MNAIFLAGIAISMIVNNGCQVVGCRRGDPILLVPGIAGSQLNVKHSGFTLCNTFGKFVGLWLNEPRTAILHGCFSSEMMLDFDVSTGQYFQSDSDDIDVRVPGFGNTRTVEQLSQTGLFDIPYLDVFVGYFVERGYERGVSIRAAPYDWRLGPEELERRGYYTHLKELIETMYSENGNTKVTLVVHSMGGPVSLHFLTSGIIDQIWKDKYIGNYITLSGAWAGGNEALMFQISGLSVVNEKSDDLFSVINMVGAWIRESLRSIIRSFQSTSVLLPHRFVWGDTVLITTPTQTYTANDYQALFSDINYPEGYAKFQGVQDINKNWPTPNVSTHCFYGVGVNTPVSFHYSKPFPEGASDFPDEIMMGDGDGTLPTLSSEVCLQWANGTHPFQYLEFRKVDHIQIIKDDNVLKKIGSIVGASHAPRNPCTTTPPPEPEEESFWDKFFGK